jgi:hypothetical protein
MTTTFFRPQKSPSVDVGLNERKSTVAQPGAILNPEIFFEYTDGISK